MEIKAFFDERTFTVTYVVYDVSTRDAVVIDPVLDYDPRASRTYSESLDLLTRFLEGEGLHLHYVLETHAHADHLSGAQRLKGRFPGTLVAIGARITEVQKVFKHIFNLPDHFAVDGSQFDRLLDDDEVVEAGSLKIKTLFTPGHTPACASFLIGDAVFTGDALFMPDYGTGRCDFPSGSATALYHSISERLYTLPNETRVFVGHDYMPGGREVAWETTIGESKASNIQLKAITSEPDYVGFREARDKTLKAPNLLFPSVQVNVDAGHLPKAEANEMRYIKVPLNLFAQDPEAR
ncbi:MAG: MBL fold metallo-hydrolase [Bradymonadia bacterium]